MADPTDTDSLADGLATFLTDRGMTVIERTPDYGDRFDPDRRKFHITAIPNFKETQNVNGSNC
jgi:hypothetical protein